MTSVTSVTSQEPGRCEADGVGVGLIHESTDNEYHEPYEYSHNATHVHLPCCSADRCNDSGDSQQRPGYLDLLTFWHGTPCLYWHTEA